MRYRSRPGQTRLPRILLSRPLLLLASFPKTTTWSQLKDVLSSHFTCSHHPRSCSDPSRTLRTRDRSSSFALTSRCLDFLLPRARARSLTVSLLRCDLRELSTPSMTTSMDLLRVIGSSGTSDLTQGERSSTNPQQFVRLPPSSSPPPSPSLSALQDGTGNRHARVFQEIWTHFQGQRLLELSFLPYHRPSSNFSVRPFRVNLASLACR